VEGSPQQKESEMTAAAITTLNPTRKIGCVIDFDNWIGNGSRANDGLDLFGIRKLLNGIGVTGATLCANWLRPTEDALLSCVGFKTRVVGKNADPAVIEEAYRLADEGCTCIVLGSGDADYLDACKCLTARGVKIILLAKQSKISRALQRLSVGTYYLDRYIAGARRPNWNNRKLNRRPQ
jgi:uncharacterized LabA/DUF88 family protein